MSDSADKPVVLAVDTPGPKRGYFLCVGSDLKRLDVDDLSVSLDGQAGKKMTVIVYPTRTYSEGFGGGLFTDIAPEDRAFIRALKARCGELECRKVALQETRVFADLAGYFAGAEEKAKYEAEKAAPKAEGHGADNAAGFFEFKPEFLTHAKRTFAACMTKPNRQDYTYLVTKTFGLNLAVRVIFMILPVRSGGLNLLRAAAALTWYQLQDTVFTVFGQTYMKFLGRMTGMLRLGPLYLGDLFFVYFQLCFFEFLNRLVLGPLGMNPLVYTWQGMGLIFLNILQGMISGGPLIPAINKMRKAGAISHNTMMHLYQLSSLTMQFGLFASFGYQKIYFLLTSATLVLSWSSYAIFSTFYKDPEFGSIADPALAERLDKAAAGCYRLGQ